MANNILTTDFDYTYPGRLSTELLYTPAVTNPEITQLFNVITGVRDKIQLNIVPALGKIVKGGQGCGTPSVTGNGVAITNRPVEVCPMTLYLEQCFDVFEGTILGELSNVGVDITNLTGTALQTAINTVLVSAISRELFRIFSFGDTSNGINDYYNMCDGLWARLFAGVSNYDVTEVNGSISSLSAADAQSYLQALYTGATNILKQTPVSERAFYVTNNVYEALMAYYETNANAGGFIAREENGVTRLLYRGIPVIPLVAWDEWIEADGLGTNVRILYTIRRNHVVAVDTITNASMMRMWYDINTRKNKTMGDFKMGYNYIHPGLQAISYGNV